MVYLHQIERKALCLSLCVSLAAAAASFITFANPDHRQDFPVRQVISEANIFQWSAAWPTDMRLEFISFVPLSLHLQCHVEKLSEGKELIESSFCFGNHSSLPGTQCLTLRPGQRSANLSLDDALVRLDFDPQLGINATLDRVAADVRLPLLDASCRLTNRHGTVQSNRVFVLDLRKYFPPAVNYSDAIITELNSRHSITLKCLDEMLPIENYLSETNQPAVPLPFRWEICNADTLNECLLEKGRRSVLNLTGFLEWPVQIREEGDLYLPFVPKNVTMQLQDKHLLCSLGRTPLAFYIEPLNFMINESSTSPLSALPEPRHVALFNTSHYELRLPCWLETSVPLSDVTWLFRKHGAVEDVVLTGKSGQKKRVTVASDGASLTFTGPFSSDIEGLYSCNVTAGEESVTSSYNVSVRSLPRIPASLLSERLVVSGKEIDLTCKFEDAHGVTPSLEVCGEQVNLSNWASVKRSRAAINKKFKHILLPLHFNVSAVRPQLRQEITYHSGPLQSNSHQVTCIGHAPPFSVRKTVLLRVLPSPAIERTFPTKSCRGKCMLACNVRELHFYEQHGLKAEVRWASTLVTASATEDWSQWERNGSTYQPEAMDLVQRKRFKCEVRLLSNASGSVLFSEVIKTDVLELSAQTWPPEQEAGNRLPTVVTATAFAVIVIASVIYFVVYRWKHRQRQSA